MFTFNIVCLIVFAFLINKTFGTNDVIISQEEVNETNEDASIINLSVVACGDRVPETLVLLKSALMFTRKKLHFYIFTEPSLKVLFSKEFKQWPEFIQDRFEYTVLETSFPEENQDEWKKLFKLCASQRLFLPDILKKVDSLLYVDTDVLFLTDLDEIWKQFKLFNESQLAALAPEHEDPNMGWYNRFARHPYYGKLGLNSGVMLMNLTRMRSFKFVDKFYPLYQTYKYNITWGDQCLLNIFFHFYPDKLFLNDCSWNYRPDHCMYGSNCKIAEVNGAHILHGCRRVFHNEKEPAFKAIYSVFENYNFSQELRKNLFPKVKQHFEDPVIARTYCGQSKDIFLKTIRTQLVNHKTIYNDALLKFKNKQMDLIKEKKEL